MLMFSGRTYTLLYPKLAFQNTASTMIRLLSLPLSLYEDTSTHDLYILFSSLEQKHL